MGTADQLLDLIYSWIKRRERCADQLRKLAEELESIREKCNIGESYGSVVSVVGAACLIGAGAATLFTGGAAAPLLGVAGAVYSGVGAAVTVVTKITEHFLSSGTMKEAQEVDQESNKTAERIQQLFEKLKAGRKEVDRFADPDELDRHVMLEMTRAMARRTGLEGRINFDDFRDEPRFFPGAGSRSMTPNPTIFHPVMVSVIGILAFFTFKMSGKKYKILFVQGGKQLVKQMSTTGLKTALKGGAMAVGGAVGMAFALPEMIDNWTEMIKKNHVTEASQSLRDTADKIRKMTKTLRDQLDDIKKLLKETAKRQRDLQQLPGGGNTQRGSKEKPEMFNTKNVVIVIVVAAVLYLSSGWKKNGNQETDQRHQDGRAAARMGLLSLRSDRHKTPQILELITQNGLDVFLTTETGLRRKTGYDVLQEASPENFNFYYQAKDRRGGGVAVQFSDVFQDELILFDFVTTFQCVAAELQHPEWQQPVLLVNVYRQSASSSAQFAAFLKELQALLDEVSECYDSVILTGDFNVQAGDEMTTSANKFEDLLRINDLVQHEKEPTPRLGPVRDLVLSRNVEISSLSVRDDGESGRYTTFEAKPASKDTREETQTNTDEDEQERRLGKKN